MTVFSGKQIVPLDYEAEVSHRLLEASLAGDLKTAFERLADPSVDVNYVGAVSLKMRKTELVPRVESASEVRVEYEEFKSDVTALFLAVHGGNVALVKKLLSMGTDVNQRVFRGFATTEAVREDHLEILEILLKAGASQPACEEALVETSCYGRPRHTRLLLGSDLIRPQVAVHALVIACCRGFLDVVETLIKHGVDSNSNDRILLRSSKPPLHMNVDCTALVAAVVSRQVSVVRLLLQAGAKTDANVRLGAWSWDTNTGEEFRVGAGLAEPYPVTWCAVEYFEASGSILQMLLQYHSSNASHLHRTLLHHAILCGNIGAVEVLLNCGANVEYPIETSGKIKSRPIHMAVRVGSSTILQLLINSGCNLDVRTDSNETALMLCARHKNSSCLKVLAMAGADFGLSNYSGHSAASIAITNQWSLGFSQVILDLIRSGNVPSSSNLSVFSPLHFVAQTGDLMALQTLIKSEKINLDYQDENGFSAVMVAAKNGHVEAFRSLVYAGADVELFNRSGETAIKLSKLNPNHDLFEKVMLQFALEKDNNNSGGFYALHCAARHGDIHTAKVLMSKGYDVNIPDGDGYTPLMLAAKEGHPDMCEVLISHGAKCDATNTRGETALSLARKTLKNDAEIVILDEIARRLVLRGAGVLKHTKGGKGNAHGKELKMVGATGMLCWGKSSRRNVICTEVEIGSSPRFMKNRKKKSDGDVAGIFRVLTTNKKEFHFVCEGGLECAKLWVRGIKLVTKEAFSCKAYQG